MTAHFPNIVKRGYTVNYENVFSKLKLNVKKYGVYLF